MNRREFLRPRRLAHSVGQVISAIDELATPPVREAPPEDIALLRLSRRAMATDFELVFPFGVPEASDAAEQAFDLIDHLEDQLTVYRDTSEVSRVNRLAASEPVHVEKNLFDLLVECARLTSETGGAFDITAGALIKAWGFFGRAGRVPTLEERREVLERTGMQHVELDAGQQTVRYLRAGLEINFGSIGKGYALDQCVDLLRSWEIRSCLLHGGHSSVYAMGSEPGSNHGWQVGVRHPWKPDCRLGVIRLKDRALATSSATFQHLEYNGRKLGHLLDPRTGWPAESMASVTVIAPSAAEADALATAFFILGVEPARRYCAAHSEMGAVLLPAHEHALPVTIGLTVDEFAPAAQ